MHQPAIAGASRWAGPSLAGPGAASAAPGPAIRLLGCVALASAVLLAVAWPAAEEQIQYWPLLASLVLFGLPHGAVDHHVAARLGAPQHQRKLVAAYLVLTAAGAALWWAAPVAALWLFFVVAALHWGSGDVWFARRVAGRARFGRPWRLVAFVVARGVLPVGLPLLAHPAAAAVGTAAILRGAGAHAAAWAPAGDWRAIGLLGIAALVAAALAGAALDHAASGRRRAGLLDGAELLLLALTMAVVSPIFAVGLYFVWWHALRHVARLMASNGAQAELMRRGRWVAALGSWHREAAPLTLVSLAGLCLLCVLAWQAPFALSAIVGAALAVIAALTVPHALVVAWMDRVELTGGLLPRRDDQQALATRDGCPAACPPAVPQYMEV